MRIFGHFDSCKSDADTIYYNGYYYDYLQEVTNVMNTQSEKLKKYIAPGKHVHLVGIGGVSMRPLGLVLKGMG